MPRLVGKSTRVVETPNICIDELAGNVASKDDRISIAHVKVTAATQDPWLTLDYDEWICVTRGRMVIHHGDNLQLEVGQGETVHVSRGERFKPAFDAETEYIPVCIPAFHPDRCKREEDGHIDATGNSEPNSTILPAVPVNVKGVIEVQSHPTTSAPKEENPEILYHMCQKELWEKAKLDGGAYYPPSFEVDGYFTHATGVPARLITTANHFYQDTEGDWICLRFNHAELHRRGIHVKFEKPMPVGNKSVQEDWTMSTWIFPHVYGGIPTVGVVDAEFPMTRDGPLFTGIIGL